MLSTLSLFNPSVSPSRNLDHVVDKMLFGDGLFEHILNSPIQEFYNYSSAKIPPANFYRKEDGTNIIELQVPGLVKEDISILTEGGTITISAEVKKEVKEEKNSFVSREFSSKSFSRSWKMPSEIDPDKIEASLKNGVLTVSIPATEAKKKKKISIE